MGTNKKTRRTGTERTASTTSLRSQVRIDFYHVDSSLQRFVADEFMQLVEAPAVKPEVHLSASMHLPDAFEVFKDDGSCLAVVNYGFADDMVPVSLETSLPARNLLEEFLCGASAFALEPCSQTLELESVFFDFTSTKELFSAGDCDVVYADVNTQLKSVRIRLDVDISGKQNMQKHLALVTKDSSCLSRPVKILPVVLWNFDWNGDSSFRSRELNFVSVESECSFVEVERHEFLEGWLDFELGGFECLRSNSVSVDDELAWQVELSSCVSIAEMVQPIPVVDFGSEAPVSNIVNSSAVFVHHINKQSIVWNFEFDCDNRLHTHKKATIVYKPYVHGERKWAMANGGWQFLPLLKQWVSLPRIS